MNDAFKEDIADPEAADEKETEKGIKMFRALPSDKQAVVIAFMNGMEVQKTIQDNGC